MEISKRSENEIIYRRIFMINYKKLLTAPILVALTLDLVLMSVAATPTTQLHSKTPRR